MLCQPNLFQESVLKPSVFSSISTHKQGSFIWIQRERVNTRCLQSKLQYSQEVLWQLPWHPTWLCSWLLKSFSVISPEGGFPHFSVFGHSFFKGRGRKIASRLQFGQNPRHILKHTTYLPRHQGHNPLLPGTQIEKAWWVACYFHCEDKHGDSLKAESRRDE